LTKAVQKYRKSNPKKEEGERGELKEKAENVSEACPRGVKNERKEK